MKFHLSLRTHILFLSISAVCLITGIFLIIYGTISLKDANDKLNASNDKFINGYESEKVLNRHKDDSEIIVGDIQDVSNRMLNDHSLIKNKVTLDGSTQDTNYLLTLALTNVSYNPVYGLMAMNTFNKLKSALNTNTPPEKIQIISINQVQVIGGADVYILVDITYAGIPPLLGDVQNVLQQNSFDPLNAISMTTNYYPSEDSNQNCGCFSGQTCPRIIPPTTTTTTTTSAPCTTTETTCELVIAVDTSSDILSPDLFNNYITVITQNLSTVINDYTNVAVINYDNTIGNLYQFGSLSNKEDFINVLNSYTQKSGSNLLDLLNSLDSIPVPNGKQMSYVVFISKNDTLDIHNAGPVANSLKSKGKLNFIILGTDVKPSYLTIGSSKPFVYDFGECDVNSLQLTFQQYLVCTSSCSSPTPCIPGPCNPNIVIAVDTSTDKLDDGYFQTEISFLQYNLTGLLSNYDFNRIALVSYNATTSTQFSFGRISNYQEYTEDINVISKRRGPGSSLTNLLTAIDQMTPIISDPISVFVFISEVDDLDVLSAISFANSISKKGNLNFIIEGTAVPPSKLSPLSPSNITIWELNMCAEDQVIDFFNSNLICPNNCVSTTTTLPPSITTTTVPQTTTTTVPQTSTTTISTTTCTPVTVSCEPNIIFAVDTSSDKLELNYFEKEISFLSLNLSNTLSTYDYSKIALASYDAVPITTFSFGKIHNYMEYIEDLNTMKQGSGSSLTNLFNSLLSFTPTNSLPVSSYIFISELNDADMATAIVPAAQLKARGGLYFIILGDAVKIEQLSPFQPTNVTTWLLDDCEEDKIINFIISGFVCSSTCGTTTSSSTTTPSLMTTTACPYIIKHCDSNILIHVDSSNHILYQELFQSEQSFLENNFTKLDIDYSRVAVSSLNQYYTRQKYEYGTIQDMDYFKTIIASLKQGPGYLLSNILTNLLKIQPQNSQPTATFVFLSDNDVIDIEYSKTYAQQLNAQGSLNFIVLGTALKEETLLPLAHSDITTWQFNECGENSTLGFFSNNFICTTECGTPTPSPTPCIEEPITCNLVIAMDTSSDILTSSLYSATIDVIQYNLSAIITDFSKVALISYDFDIHEFHNFNSIQDRDNFNNIVKSYKQHAGSSLKNLLYFFDSLISATPDNLSFLIFVAKTHSFDAETYNLVANLKSKGQFNIVILGTDVNPYQISSLGSSEPFVYNFGECDKANLTNKFTGYLDCSTTCISSPTPCVDGPCEPNIIFALDASDKLDSHYFDQQKGFFSNLTNTLFNNFDYSRLALTAYNDQVVNQYTFGNIINQELYLLDIYTVKQSSGSNLTNLLYQINQLQPVYSDQPISTYVMISHYNEIDIISSITLAAELNAKGGLYFIILGTDVHAENLSPLKPKGITTWLLDDCEEDKILNFIDSGLTCESSCNPPPITTTTTTTTTSCPNVIKDCDSNILIHVDSSNHILYQVLFQTEQLFLENNFTTLNVDYSNVAVSSINQLYPNQRYEFGTITNMYHFKGIIASINQGPGYQLSYILNNLLMIKPQNSQPTATFVFLSDNDVIDIDSSYIPAQQLMLGENTLNFIVLGTALKEEALLPLNPSAITTWQFSECGEALTLQFFENNFICTEECGTIPPTPCIEGPVTCNLVIAMDTSSDILLPYLYQSTLNVIQQNISNLIVDYSKVGLVGWDYDVHEFHDFDTIPSSDVFNSIVANYKQHPGSSLKNLLNFLINLQTPSQQMSYLIMIADAQNFDGELTYLMNTLRSKGKLDFIILGTDISPYVLSPYSTYEPFVYNFGECDIKNLTSIFSQYLDCYLNCPSTTTPVTTTTSIITTTTTSSVCIPPASDCLPNIIIALDSSSDKLSYSYFVNETSYISMNFTSLLQGYDYNNVALIPYSGTVSTKFTFGTINNVNEFKLDLYNLKQSSGNGLTNLLTILNQQKPNNNNPIATYIFISDVDDNDVQNAIQQAAELKAKGNLYFIILGTAIKDNQLTPLQPTSITTWLLDPCGESSLNLYIQNGLYCPSNCPESVTTTTLPPPTTTTSCPSTELICNPNLIVGVDISNDKLEPQYFNEEISFLWNNFTQVIGTSYNRVDLAYYNGQAVNFKQFGKINTMSEWQQDLYFIQNTIQQGSGSNLESLLSILINYLSQPNTPPDGKPVSSYIFISSNDTTISSSIGLAQQLASKGNLNFIIIGTSIKPEVLEQLVPLGNIYQWDFATCTIESLLEFIKNTLYCYCSETPVPTTTTTTIAPITENCGIVISVDVSNDVLDTNEFNYLINTIQNDVSTLLAPFTRVALEEYASSNIQTYDFGSIVDVNSFKLQVGQFNQQPGTSLYSALSSLNSQLSFDKVQGTTIFVFITSKNVDDIQTSIPLANALNAKGSLNFIIVGTAIKVSDLTSLVPLTNIYVWDYSNCPISELLTFISTNAKCTATQITTTTTVGPAINPNAFSPCKSLLIFSVATSTDKITSDQYDKQLELFTMNNFIDTDFNHFERIGVVAYNENPEVIINFNEATSLDDFNLKFALGIQSNKNTGNSLTNLLKQLSDVTFMASNNLYTKNYFIFISNISPDDINNAVTYAQQIKNNNGYLNFIILDNTNPSSLATLSPKYILSWNSQNDDDVSDFLLNYIYCSKKKRRSIGH